MNPEAAHEATWPYGKLVALLVMVAVFSLIAASTYKNTRSSFTHPLVTQIYALFALRVLIAAVRRERSQGWIVYVILLFALPVAAMIYADMCIPLHYYK